MKVLVYGFYDHGNLGDQLFITAFQSLFPSFTFTFTDKLNVGSFHNQEAVFFGGGSFLDQAASITPSAIPILQSLPLFYLGVGAETNIHPIHQQLLKSARLVVLRSPDKLDEIRALNPNVFLASDLVYCHPPASNLLPPIPKSILFLPNCCLVPQWNEPHWKHLAWEYGKFEIAQFLDRQIEEGYSIQFFPMCLNNEQDDTWAAIEIIGKMQRRSHSYLLTDRPSTTEETVKLFSKHEIIITQRYHGIVLADLAARPVLTLAHHDKLKAADEKNLSFYGLNKRSLIKAFEETKIAREQPLSSHQWREAKQQIERILIGGENGSAAKIRGDFQV